MIDIEANVDIDTNDFLESFADAYAKQLEQGGMDCPADDCGSETFDVEMWVDNDTGIEGAAVCRGCNARIDLNIDDSEVKDAITEIEDAFESAF